MTFLLPMLLIKFSSYRVWYHVGSMTTRWDGYEMITRLHFNIWL